MPLRNAARRPWRELCVLGLGLGLMALWELTVKTSSAVPLALIVVLAVAYHFWLRRAARRKLVPVSDEDFFAACNVPSAGQEVAMKLRVSIGEAFGLPADRIAADVRFRDLMALTGWFGSDLLALNEVQDAADALSAERREVHPGLTIGELVAHAARASSPRT